MISDICERTGSAPIETDVCVVGAGPAGLMVALTLADQGIRTLLLESGAASFDPGLHDLNTVMQTAKPNDGVSGMRFRALGGTATRWGGQVLPFFPIDLAARPWLGLEAWPVTIDDLAPHYDAALCFFGLDDAISDDVAVWRRWRQDEPDYGEALRPFLSRWCRVPDLGTLYRDRIARHATLDCILRATVTALHHDDGAVTGLSARSLDGAAIEVRARHIVLAIGAGETPRLLLQPLADGNPAPWASNDALGRYFQDHPGLVAADVVPLPRSALHRELQTFWAHGIKYQPRIRLSDAAQQRERVLNVGGGVMAQTADLELLAELRAAAGALLRAGLSTRR